MNNSIFTIGMILLVLGVLASVFSLFGDFDLFPDDSRGKYMTGFIILGIIVMIVASALPSISTTSETGSAPETTTSNRRTRTTVTQE